MAERIQLDVITPERRLLSETVDAVTVPGMNGEIGILPGHTPLISQLQTGVLSYTQGTTIHRMLVSGGFVEVNDERVSVLADIAERPDEVDATQARQEREAAEKALGSFSGSEEEMTQMRTRLERAAARLELSSGR
ncbi:MAG: F0F1 ATP synthase subunit epsilon [Pyrinomonadaceae bacterium]|nr:F0F1 ATP synthase subunit epsilon [Pyrinomonadaceae bacterium]